MKQPVLTVSIIAALIIGIGSMIFSANPTILQQQMSIYAQPMNNTTTPEVITTTKNVHNTTSPGQTIVHRGIISSEKPAHIVLQPGEELHSVLILPHRPDEATFTGILTFTATKPVEVGFGHRIPIDNATVSQLDTDTFGEIYKRHYVQSQQTITPGIISVPSVIVPDYGTQPPYFSASIPFVGSSIWLRTPHGEPFTAVYEVSAQVVQPQAHVADVDSAASRSANLTITTTNQTG